MKRYWYLILPTIVLLVSICDLGATLYCDRHVEHFEEANPVAEYIWETHGTVGLVTFKLTVTLVSCILMVYIIRHKDYRWSVAVSVFGLSVCLFLVGWWVIFCMTLR